jgi:hypothetical protein
MATTTQAPAAKERPRLKVRYEGELRQQLQVLDAGLREAAALDPRPYQLSARTEAGSWQLSYTGEPLTPEQEREVRRYIDFVRSTGA